MKNALSIILVAAFFLIQCGGSAGALGQENKELLIDFPDPVVSFSLSASDYEYQLIVYSETADGMETVFGPVSLASYNTDTNTYSARADDLLFGSYYAEIRLVKTTVAEDEDSLPISKAEFALDLTENRQTISLSSPEWDDTAFDDDADGKSNLEEVGFGTDPRNEDSDGDGVSDSVDAFPLDAGEAYDFDGDGFGDSHDSDIDNDGLTNDSEAEIGTDPILPDTDFDGVLDGDDSCPLKSNASQADLDGDGVGEECDDDRDGDGLTDAEEVLRGSSPILVDSDEDGVPDGTDLFPTNATDSADNDSDGTGDNADTDDDNDGVSDADEIVSGLNPQNSDSDGDDIRDGVDNCGLISNPGQNNNDHDAHGDDCDDDDDNDNLTDSEESVIGEDGFVTNPKLADSDGDGFEDAFDNCPNDDNITQTDVDADKFGTACDCDDADSAINQLAEDLPDPQVMDSNCDGLDGNRYESVFVSVTGASSASDTAYGSATSDLQGALNEAVASDKVVLVAAGDYNISGLSVPDGVAVYGGYSETFLDRDILAQTYETRFINPVLSDDGAVITLQGLNEGVVFGGVTFSGNSDDALQIVAHVDNSTASFENCEFSGSADATSEYLLILDESDVTINGSRLYGEAIGLSTGILAENSSLKITNSLFVMGDADHTRGMELTATSGIIANNTIDGGRHVTGTSYGVIFLDGAPEFFNNVFITQNDRNQTSLFCSGLAPENEVILENNAFLRLTSRELTYPAYVQCDGSAFYTVEELDQSVELDSRDNLVETSGLESILANYVDVESYYVPSAGSPLIDNGVNTDDESEGQVTFDLFGRERILDSYDIGATEL